MIHRFVIFPSLKVFDIQYPGGGHLSISALSLRTDRGKVAVMRPTADNELIERGRELAEAAEPGFFEQRTRD
jgi:hypothetical protein